MHPPPLVAVYSMGRTGSRSVAGGVERACGRVYHVHQLLDAEQKHAAAPAKDLARSLQLLRDSDGLRRPVSFVTLVRDPIACLLSSQFRKVHGVADPSDSPPVPNELRRKPKLIVHWFEREFEPALGVDVYQHPFDRSAGFATLDTGLHRILLLQSELEDDRKSAIVSDFLGLSVTIDRSGANPSELAWRDAYRAWLDVVAVAEPHLDYAYGSRLARHFYAPGQIEAFRRRWERPVRETSAGAA